MPWVDTEEKIDFPDADESVDAEETVDTDRDADETVDTDRDAHEPVDTVVDETVFTDGDPDLAPKPALARQSRLAARPPEKPFGAGGGLAPSPAFSVATATSPPPPPPPSSNPLSIEKMD